MKFGFIPTEGGHFYKASLQEVEYGEKLGFDSVWMEEHHGVKNHYWPSPLIVLAGYATRTTRLILGTDIAILPFYNPVRVAEEAALLDVMSGGRFILGLAIGYRPEEFAMMDAPMAMRGARFAEAITLIRRLWAEDNVTFEGKYYSYKNVMLEPKPVAKPCPPIWVGGWGPLALKRAAELGDAWVPGPTAVLKKLLDCQAAYRQHLKALDKDLSTVETPLTREMVVAETDAKAWEMAEKHLLVNYRDEYAGGWEHPLIGKEDAARVDRLAELGQDRFIVGSPETCIKQIERFRETFGMDHLIFRLYFPGVPHEFIMNELKLIGQEIFPAFRSS